MQYRAGTQPARARERAARSVSDTGGSLHRQSASSKMCGHRQGSLACCRAQPPARAAPRAPRAALGPGCGRGHPREAAERPGSPRAPCAAPLGRAGGTAWAVPSAGCFRRVLGCFWGRKRECRSSRFVPWGEGKMHRVPCGASADAALAFVT